jgi:hypothetical protein
MMSARSSGARAITKSSSFMVGVRRGRLSVILTVIAGTAVVMRPLFRH